MLDSTVGLAAGSVDRVFRLGVGCACLAAAGAGAAEWIVESARVTGFNVEDGTAALSWLPEAGSVAGHVIEGKTNLADAAWIPLATNRFAAATNVLTGVSGPRWFFRKRTQFMTWADARADTDGDGMIDLHEVWARTDPLTADTDVANRAVVDAAAAVDARIAGKSPSTAWAMFTNYFVNGASGMFTRNADCWAADIDLSFCSPWNSQEAGKRAGTLISRRHVLFAAHYPVAQGHTITFADCFGGVVTRTVTVLLRHPNYSDAGGLPYPDFTVGLLDAEVPAAMSVAKVLPDDYGTYLGNGFGVPCLWLDQAERVCVGDTWCIDADLSSVGLPGGHYAGTLVPTAAERQAFTRQVVGGDSSNPLFILINGEAVLLSVWTYGSAADIAGVGTSVTGLKTDIQAMMDTLAPGGDYRLEEIDLSGFEGF
jgi:hypothetical protein